MNSSSDGQKISSDSDNSSASSYDNLIGSHSTCTDSLGNHKEYRQEYAQKQDSSPSSPGVVTHTYYASELGDFFTPSSSSGSHLSHICAQSYELGNIRWLFTHKHGGVSPEPYDSLNVAYHVGDEESNVLANRKIIAESIGKHLEDFMWMDQIHESSVAISTPDELYNYDTGEPYSSHQFIESTDAIVAVCPDKVLTVMVADCVPLILADPISNIVAVVHAGRKGIERGIVPKTVAVMTELGAHAGDIYAHIGPCASGEMYEVPQQLAQNFFGTLDIDPQLIADTGLHPISTSKKGVTSIDLPASVTLQLTHSSVKHITVSSECSITSNNVFSYRRAHVTGRFAGLIWLDHLHTK